MEIISEPVFINLSNHPSANWEESQREAAKKWGEIRDVPFPEVRADASSEEVRQEAAQICESLSRYQNMTAMVQGEFTLTYHIVRMLKDRGCRTVAACTRRDARETVREDGTRVKESVFRFVRFREY